MRKIFWIALQHVRQIALYKPFLVSVLLGPLLVWLGATGVNWLWQADANVSIGALNQTAQTQIIGNKTGIAQFGYVDQANLLRAPSNPDEKMFVPFADETRARHAVAQNEIAGYYVIPRDFLAEGAISFFSAERMIDETRDTQFEQWIVKNLARAEDAVRVPRIVEPIRAPAKDNAADEWFAGLGLALTREMNVGVNVSALFLFALFLLGSVLLQPMVREREGKILEVLLSAVSPTQFLLGKFFGALTIAAFIVASVLGWSFVFARGENHFFAREGVTLLTLGIAGSGFLLYAALFLVFGAWLDLYPESNRIPTLIAAITLMPLVILLFTNAPPHSPSAVVLSLLPPFTPTVLLWRTQLGEISVLEIGIALSLMWLATIFCLWFAVYWFQRNLWFETRAMIGRKTMRKKILTWGIGLVWFGTLVYFTWRAAVELTWTDVFVAFVSALAVCVWIGLRAAQFSNWRAFGLVLFAHLLAQAWLQWQWALWDTPLQNVNTLAALLAWDSFCAVLCVSVLLLIRRDASVIALAVVWLGCPLGLVLSMARYSNIAQTETLPLRDSSILLSAMCFLGFLAAAGIVAFGAHFLRLLYVELAAKV